MASLLGLPPEVLKRHPFPGPGLAVRIIGEVTPEKVRMCRGANAIVEQVMKEEKLYDKVWQAFAYLGDDRVTGVLGDERTVGAQVTVRVGRVGRRDDRGLVPHAPRGDGEESRAG